MSLLTQFYGADTIVQNNTNTNNTSTSPYVKLTNGYGYEYYYQIAQVPASAQYISTAYGSAAYTPTIIPRLGGTPTPVNASTYIDYGGPNGSSKIHSIT